MSARVRIISRRSAIKGALAAAVAARLRPARALIPLGGSASASPGQTFDFYISTTGSDTNTGTLASPWAITSLTTSSANWSKLAGKRIGLLPGTYNVGSMMANDAVSGALQIPGGSSSSWTYLGSSTAGGHYSPHTAIITAFYNGLYGGHNATSVGSWNGPILSHSGQYPTTYPVGWLVIDGIVFSGFSYKGVRIGGASSGEGPIITGSVTVQNCEFTGGGYNPGDYQDNMNALWLDPIQPTGAGYLITNNWVHDNFGHGGAGSADHLNGIFLTGFQQLLWGAEISYNTCVNAGNIYGKEGGISGCNVHHNYVDMSMFSSNGSVGIQDFMSGGQSFTVTHSSSFHHNVVVLRGNTPGGSVGLGWPTLNLDYGWQTPVSMYNNTFVVTAGSAGPVVLWADAALDGSGIGQLQAYNNIYVNHGSGGSWNGYGNFLTTAKSAAIWDYNLFPSSGVQWAVIPDANNQSLSGFGNATYIHSSASTFASAISSGGGISGAEAHSIAGAPTFAGIGLYGAQYQLATGSTGVGAGSSDGTPGGTAVDMGACGNVNSPITVGCSFAT